MMPHDIFTMISAKTVEYLIAVAFLVLFLPFWRFVNGGRLAEQALASEARNWLGDLVGWFMVPDRLHFSLGHAWVGAPKSDVVAVGMDDFAHKLVGKTSEIRLPQIGSSVAQGEKGWTLFADGKSVDMLSPVDGTVVAVNEKVKASGGANGFDPYGEGWLFQVKPSRLEANLKHLLTGSLARRWMEDVGDKLRTMMSADLGQVYQDGGMPIDGIARGLEQEKWDQVCKRFFLT
jgi:glycine cleavage system H lipoate-binding protein